MSAVLESNGHTHTAAVCRLCSCGLNEAEDDDFELSLCSSCQGRPETRRLGLEPPPNARTSRPAKARSPELPPAREFTPAERSLIAKVNNHLPALQLLELLNERLMCDLGAEASPYTMRQLMDAIAATGSVMREGPLNWAGLRKLIDGARRSGTLKAVNDQVINDFAVIFSLNPKQVLGLKEALLDEEGV